MGHMGGAHTTTRWRCAAASHSEEVFETESQFAAHVDLEHKELFNEEEVAELANLSSFESPRNLDATLWPECPICTEPFDGNDFPGVLCHIAKELVEYAFLSLLDPPNLVVLSQQGSHRTSLSNYTMGRRRESELDMEQALPWDLWESGDSAATAQELRRYEDECADIPLVDADHVESLAQVWEAIWATNNERLKKEPEIRRGLQQVYPALNRQDDTTIE